VAVLPEALSQMLALASLMLRKCEGITLLPPSITRLSRLECLALEVMVTLFSLFDAFLWHCVALSTGLQALCLQGTGC
jgi:hypothetical protein